jgi:hypothetical protein
MTILRQSGQARTVRIFIQALLTLSLLLSVNAQPTQAATSPAALPQTTGPTTGAIRLLESDGGRIILELTTPAFRLVDDIGVDGPCQRVEIAGYAQGGAAGTPALPVRVTSIGVPAGAAWQVTTTVLETETAATAFTPCPASQAVREEGENGAARYVEAPAPADPSVYGIDAYFPREAALVDDLGQLRSQRLARVELRPFQVNPVTGELVRHGRVRVELTFDAAQVMAASSADVTEAGGFEQLLAGSLLNYAESRQWRVPTDMAQAAAADTAVAFWTPPSPGYRVLVEQDGIHVLSYAALAAAGLPVDALDPATLRLYGEGKELAVQVTGQEDGRLDDGDALYFYGEPSGERYARYNVYWLTYGGAAGKRISTASAPSAPEDAEWTPFTVRNETNKSYVSAVPMQDGYDHWYGERITVVVANAAGRLTEQFAVAALAASAGDARVTVTLASGISGEHDVRLYVNGDLVGEDSWDGNAYHTVEIAFPATHLRNGQNELAIELVNNKPGRVVDLAYIDWTELRYPRGLVAGSGQFEIHDAAPGAWRYRVTGLNAASAQVLDVTDAATVQRVSTTVAGSAVTFAGGGSAARRYIAFTADQAHPPAGIEAATASDLLNPSEGASYIIISHGDFLEAIAPLAEYRRFTGYRVKVIDVQAIYDAFNYGRPSAEAIRDFLRYAYAAWPKPTPTHVLLVGDGNYDPRQYLESSVPTYLPPFLVSVDPDLGETAADNRYAAIAGNDITPDLYVGRFPANSAADVTAMVNKTIAYETRSGSDGWQENILFVTDNLEGGGGAFYNFSDAVADGLAVTAAGVRPLVPDGFTKQRVYLGLTCPDEKPATTCRNQVIAQMNQGALFVSYIGHGIKEYWAEEQVLTQASLAGLTNADRLPIMFPMTCMEGYFQEPQADSAAFGEAIVRLPEVGAVASWSPTGFGLVTGHDYLQKGAWLGYFHYDFAELGAATNFGKLYLMSNAPTSKYDDLVDTFLIFGDPALRISRPGDGPAASVYLPLLHR